VTAGEHPEQRGAPPAGVAPGRARAGRWLGVAIGAALAAWALYMLALGKAFSPAVAPSSWRDLGILWDNAHQFLRQRRYLPGYYFPPPAYLLVSLYGQLGHDLAFRLYLLVQELSLGAGVWAWTRLIGLFERPRAWPAIGAAVLAASFFIHVDMAMSNANAETFALVSLALLFCARPGLSAGAFALSLAIKPYSQTLLLPWMAWRGRWRWVAAVLAWLLLFYVALPSAWFGLRGAAELTGQWLGALAGVGGGEASQHLSIGGGLSVLFGLPENAVQVRMAALGLQLGWLAAVGAFLAPALRRRADGVAAAYEAAALLLVALPLGGHQQPARFIALLPSTLLIAAAAFDARRPAPARLVLAAILAAIGVASWTTPVTPAYFLLTLGLCALALAGLTLARVRAPAPLEATAPPNAAPVVAPAPGV